MNGAGSSFYQFADQININETDNSMALYEKMFKQ